MVIMHPIFVILIIVLWIYILHVLNRTELHAWRFLWGSMGLFIILMITVRPVLTMPLARCVSALAGIVGNLTGFFEAYFKYGVIFIGAEAGSITLQVDFECSGIIEIMAFLCLLAFFNVYNRNEKLMVGIIGVAYIMVCNALRIIIICMAVHFWGVSAYYVFHTFIGRIVFYGLSVLLYFYVFTKPQIIQMKVGSFTYGDH